MLIKKLFIILLILCLPSVGWAAVCTAGSGVDTCRVSQDGTGADYTAAQFNALSGDYSDDIFYFITDGGNFTTRITNTQVEGTSGHPVTLDGYEDGDCDPLNSECSSSALLTDGMITGNQTHGPDYITIQDFRMTRQTGTGSCFTFYGYLAGADDAKHVDHVIVRRNYVYETNGTMFYYYSGRYLIVKGNKFIHFGQNDTNATQGVSIIEVDNALFTSNEFGHDEEVYDSGCTSANIVEVHHCFNQLWEYNDIYGAPVQTGIAFKELQNNGSTGNGKIIFRFNKVHHNDTPTGNSQFGISWGAGRDTQSYFYCYGNNVYSNRLNGLATFDDADDSWWWSNIVHDNGDQGFLSAELRFPSQGKPDHVMIVNNTFSRNGSTGADPNQLGRGGIVVANGTDYTIKNNLLYNNRRTGALGLYHQIRENISSDPALEHNTLFHSSATATWYWNGGIRSLATMKATYGRENDPPAGEVTDPGFVNPDGADTTYGTDDDDYRLTAQGTLGDDLGQCFTEAIDLSGGSAWFETNSGYGRYIEPCLDDALDPSATDWTTTPPTVSTVKRSTYGWSRGAYAFKSRRRIFFVD